MKRHPNDETNCGRDGSRASKRLCSDMDVQRGTPISSAIQARTGLQRSLCLAIRHLGFDSTTPEALESFTALVETYIASLIEDMKQKSLSCRREQPTPADFALSLKRFNLSTDLLQPHRRNPIHPALLASLPVQETTLLTASLSSSALPLLGPELSGHADRSLKQHIPNSFPDFPSLHTYRCTPGNASNSGTVKEPGRIREAAAKSAKEGEDALRKLVRAAKMRNQKEARTVADRDVGGRHRYRLWDAAMKSLLQGLAPPSTDTGVASLSSSDQGTIVNSDSSFLRREVSRGGKRAGAGAVDVNSSGYR